MKLYKILHAIFLIAIMISCSQETVINKSITEKLNAPDTKMCIDIVTEKSRTVRPEIAKWQIDIELLTPSDAVKSEDNSETLRFSRIIGGRITSTTFINVTTGNYKISVSGKTENDVTILSGKNDNFPVDTYEINTCTIEMKDTFDNNSKSTDGSGHLNVTISGLNGLFTDGEDFILTYRKLPESDNGTRITLNYENGTLTGKSEEPIPAGSYKIDITHDDETKTKVNLVKDPVVNIYPDATTDINWEWSYDSDKINADHDLKDLKIPVWNKNADRNNNVGYIGADALFAYPDMTDETFVACDTDDADNMWVLTITDTTEETTDEATTVTNTYKLKNLNTNNEYYFTSKNTIEDFTIATLNLNDYLDNPDHDFEDNEKAEIKEYFGEDKMNYLLLLVKDTNNDEEDYKTYIDSCYIKKLPTKKDEPLPAVPVTSYSSSENGEFWPNNYWTISIAPQTITSIEVSGTYLYIAGTRSTNYLGDINRSTSRHLNSFASIYKGKISMGITIEISEDTTILTNNNESQLCVTSVTETNDIINTYPYNTPILTLDIGEYFTTDNPKFIQTFLNGAFKVSDMYVKNNTLYITAGCVNYYQTYKEFGSSDSDTTTTTDSLCYSFGGLFKYTGISGFYVDEETSEIKQPDKYSWNDTTKKVTFPKIDLVYGLDTNIQSQNELTTIQLEYHETEEFQEYYALKGLMQAETDDSPYFAGPRSIIPSGNKLFIIDSGFYGEYNQTEDESTGEKTTIFTLQDKRNRIFTFDTTSETLSPTKVDDSISFDYDYITETELTEKDENENVISIPVSW